jgi:hypothetical protein
MIQKIKNYFLLNKKIFIIFSFLFISSIAITLYSFNYKGIWWDEAVYIGMGKYIASGGIMGLWEMFRPPLLPLIYSFLFKLNIPLLIAGKIIVILFSLASVWITYRLAEAIKKDSGIFASIFLVATPVFFFFTKFAITDIISVFFCLLSLLFYSKNKYFWVGISIGFAFLLRFPQGLILLPMGIVVILDTYNKNLKTWFYDSFYRGILIILGFFIIALPYFISNYLLYGGLLKPLVAANNIVSWSGVHYNLGIFYYIKELFLTAPFLYLSFIFPFFIIKKDFFINEKAKKFFRAILITFFIYFIYFSWQSHKELRYSVAFIPYLAILSSVSVLFLLKFFNRAVKIIVIIIIITSFLLVLYKATPFIKNDNIDPYISINNYFSKMNGNYISTTPNPVIFGSVKISKIFDSVDNFNDAFTNNKELDGVIINSCDIYCPEKNIADSCYKDLIIINNKLNDFSYPKIYEKSFNKCTFSIYQK